MKLRVEKIRYKNIREFGDLELDFTRDGENETHHISLVQMPNGTGKTTTMGLIRRLILGAELEEHQVREYRPAYEVSDGEFSISFASGDTRFRLHMDLDYEMGTVKYRHSRAKREGGGSERGHWLPLELEATLTEAFVDLFVFNGELTDKFIQTGNDQAETALKIVNRLDRIEEQRKYINRIVEKRQEGSGVKKTQGLKQAQTKLKKREERLKEIRAKRDDLEAEIRTHESRIEEFEKEREEIIAENQDALQKYKSLEKVIQDLGTELNTETKKLLAEMRRPSHLSSSFSSDFDELLEHMTILQLPKSTSEEFFNELSEGDTCICGRELDDEHRAQIRKNAGEYLSDEDIGVLNTLKEQLRNTPDVLDFESRFENLAEKRRELKQKEMAQDRLDLGDSDLEEKKQELTEKIEEERTARDEKEEMVEFITTDDKRKRDRFNLDWKENIPEAKREVSRYKKKVEEGSDTVELSRKAEKLERIFDAFIKRSLEDLKDRQISKTNERLKQILKLSEVQIESIDDSITLKGKSGSSEGQALSVAYAYLSTLFEGSKVDMPFIVDSPAVSLDHKVRGEVAPIISGLFDQLIAFVISTEKDGFVTELEPKTFDAKNDIQYYTIHKTSSPGEIEKHTDEEFFMEFTSEEEESPAMTEGAQ